MSSDVTAQTGDSTPESTGVGNLAETSRRMLEESFNEGKLDLADQFTSPDAINHDPAEPARIRGLRGPDVFRQTVAAYRAAFPDLKMTVDDVIAADDKVVLRWHSEGTHRGELEGLAPTGVRVSVTGISIDRWQDGKVVEAWTEWDNLGLARRLGAAPPEGSLGEKIGMGVQRVIARRMRKNNG